MTIALRDAVIGLAIAIGGICAQAAVAPGGFYTCRDASGKVLSKGQQEVVGCPGRQTFTDGVGHETELLTPKQILLIRACEKKRDALITERRRTDRLDSSLLTKFPDEAAHREAREAALEPKLAAIRRADAELVKLASARKKLMDEKEFVPASAPLPSKLQLDFNANDGLTEVATNMKQKARDEAADVNARYDKELAHLRKLWADDQSPALPVIDCSASALSLK